MALPHLHHQLHALRAPCRHLLTESSDKCLIFEHLTHTFSLWYSRTSQCEPVYVSLRPPDQASSYGTGELLPARDNIKGGPNG